MKRILVIDDNQLNADLAKVMLGRAGYQVASVERGDLAIEFLVGNRVDAILTDISMPGMSGKDLCRYLRQRMRDKCPRLVAYTAFALDHQRQSIMEAGFDALVVKPARADALIRALDPDAPAANEPAPRLAALGGR